MSRHGFSEILSCSISKMNMMELIEDIEDDEQEEENLDENPVRMSLVSDRKSLMISEARKQASIKPDERLKPNALTLLVC